MINTYDFIENINSDTSIANFENNVQKNPAYTFADISQNGWTALGIAAVQGNLEIVNFILSNASNSNELANQQFSDYGWTPLFAAALCENQQKALNIAFQLIKSGADLNAKTKNECDEDYPAGMTPIWGASKNNHCRLVSFFLNRRASEEITHNHSENQKKLINDAGSVNKLLNFWKDNNPLPQDILKIIQTFMFDLS